MKPAAALSILALAIQSSAQHDGLQVPTDQGDVLGTFSSPKVRQYLGIPFATAERWQNPVLPPKRNEVFNATAFGDSCIQLLDAANVEFNRLAWTFGRDNETFVPESEDCLTLNIWSPSLGRKQNTAVLVWIYGGGFVWGTSRLPIYDGTNLVQDNEDITVVTLNYRLNIFGQPNAPQLDVPGKVQNFGLLDVESAVRWVHDNIKHFGGDPERMTIFGQSAGAVIVDAYALAHPDDKIVKGLIQQSGNSLVIIDFAASTSPDGSAPRINTSNWNTISESVGCGDSPTAMQFACMQRVPSKRLEDAVIRNDVSFNLVFDEISLFSDPISRIAAGQSLNVPVLHGSTQNEADVFTVAAELVSGGKVIPTISEILSDIGTSTGWLCPLQTVASAYRQAGRQAFQYQYQAVFPNLSLRPELRAFHGSEIHLVFGTYNNSPIASQPAEIALSKYIQSVWVEFARDPEQGLGRLGWPQFDPGEPTYALFGGPANQTGAFFADPGPFTVICQNLTLLQDTFLAFQSLPIVPADDSLVPD